MPGLTRFPKPKPEVNEQILEIVKRLEEKINELERKLKEIPVIK